MIWVFLAMLIRYNELSDPLDVTCDTVMLSQWWCCQLLLATPCFMIHGSPILTEHHDIQHGLQHLSCYSHSIMMGSEARLLLLKHMLADWCIDTCT